jgi:hypothetical protein
MTTHKVADLAGKQLHELVAKLEGANVYVDSKGFLMVDRPFEPWDDEYQPSVSWHQGGPIIERERINLSFEPAGDGSWHAELEHPARDDGVQRSFTNGPTALVAAMRAYVSSKFGDTVELP